MGLATIGAPKDTTKPSLFLDFKRQWGAAVTFEAEAADTCGIVFPIRFFLDGVEVATANASPHTLVLTDVVRPGDHILRLTASDHCGNTQSIQRPFTKHFTPPTAFVQVDPTVKKKPVISVSCTSEGGTYGVVMLQGRSGSVTDALAPYTFELDTSGWRDAQDASISIICIDIYGVPSQAVQPQILYDNTGPTYQFSVYGLARNYTSLVDMVADPRGVESVKISFWQLPFPLVTRTMTTGPFSMPIELQGASRVQGGVIFYTTATDTWGNKTCRGYVCTVDSESNVSHPLDCSLQAEGNCE